MRQKKSDAVRIAQIQADQALTKEVLQVLCDPLWSSVLGFIAVHEARKANLVGPVADDILYGGIIAINSSRSGLVKEAAGLAEGAMGMVGGKIDQLVTMLPAALGI